MRRLTLAATLALAACAGATTTVRTVDTRPALAGDAQLYDGNPNVLRLEPGTHLVEIRDRGGNVVYSQRIFVESELKTVQVH